MLSTAVLRSPSFWNCFFISEIRFTFLLRLGDIGPVLRSGKLTAHEMRYCALNLLFSKIPSMEFADCDEWSDLDKAEDVCQIDGCRPSVHGVKSNKINKLPKAYGVPIGSLINLHDLIVFLEVFHMSSVSGGTSVMADKKSYLLCARKPRSGAVKGVPQERFKGRSGPFWRRFWRRKGS